MTMLTRRSLLTGFAGLGVAAAQSAFREPPSAMTSSFKLSVLTDEIAQDFGRACEVAAREFGLGFVDLREMFGKNIMKWDAAEVGEARKTLETFSLRVACIASPIYKVDWPGAPKSKFSPTGTRDQFGADFTYAQQDELLDRAFDLARTFNTDRIRIFDFWRLDDQAPHRRAIDDVVRQAAARAGKKKLTLVIENEPACNTATAAEAARLLGAIPDPALELTWDPGNAVTRGETPFPDGYAKLPTARIGHVHCKDAVPKSSGDGWDWMAMGRGVIDWAGQFRALDRDGYRGAVTLETHWRGGLTPEEASRQSFAGMKELLRKAGL
jgi:sugar phosphate isomerase/epimerase